MEPNVHFALHQARVADAQRRHERLAAQRPRPPGRARQLVASRLRGVADRLEAAPAAAARHA